MLNKVLRMVEAVKWDAATMSNDNNPYVATLLETLSETKARVRSVLGGSAGAGSDSAGAAAAGAAAAPPHPSSSSSSLRPGEATAGAVWAAIVDCVMDDLLEAFSRVRRCSEMGRALMSMDLDAIQRGLTAIEASPAITRAKRRVDSLIKGFYVKESDLVDWAAESMSAGLLTLRHVASVAKQDRGPLRDVGKKRKKEIMAAVEAAWAEHQQQQ